MHILRCDPNTARHSPLSDLDGDGRPEELVTFDCSNVISAIGLEKFYAAMGPEQYCPANGYSHHDGKEYLKLSSGQSLSQLERLQHFYDLPEGRTLHRGQRVKIDYPLMASRAGVIESFSDSFDIFLPSGALVYRVNVRLDDGTLLRDVDMDVVFPADTLSSMKRSLFYLYRDVTGLLP